MANVYSFRILRPDTANTTRAQRKEMAKTLAIDIATQIMEHFDREDQEKEWQETQILMRKLEKERQDILKQYDHIYDRTNKIVK